jgi:hypothetical protein
MNINDLSKRVSDLQISFDGLKDNMSLFQQNISNNITWFYAALGIILVVILPSLYFLVKTSVSKGIENGILKVNNNLLTVIQEEKQLNSANGTVGALGVKEIVISGLLNFSYIIM